jgi:hypothetical protein
MAGSPDDSSPGAARAVDPEDSLAAAEAAHLAARETVPLPAGRRPAGPRSVGPGDTGETVRPARRRPARRRPEPGRPRPAPLALAAAVAATWAALLSYLPVAGVLGLVQVVEGGGSLGGAARVGMAGWLLGHGVPLATSSGPLGLTPLALTGLAAWRLARAGVHTTRAVRANNRGSPGRALTVGATVGLAYGVLGALAAAVVTSSGAEVSPARAGATLAGFGAVAALAGALRATGALGPIAFRTTPALRDGLRTGVVAGALVLAAGALTAGVAIATAGGDAADTIAAYRTGVAGQAGITLLCLAYAPNVAIWAAAYLVGPGFALGEDSAVRFTEVTVGAVPAVPLSAGLPTAPLEGPAALALGGPVLAGIVAGWLLARRARAAGPPRHPVRWRGVLGGALLAGPVAGVLLGLAAVASGGPLGAGRLAEVGPVGWQVAAVSSGVVALGAVTGAGATWVLASRRG